MNDTTKPEDRQESKPWIPTEIRRTKATPHRIRTEEQRVAWRGKSGVPARGMMWNTTRRVEDDKASGIRTIVNAPRRERMAATPIGERFSAQLREAFTASRLERKRKEAEAKAAKVAA